MTAITPIHDVFVVAVVAVVWIIPALLVARLAERKGRNFAAFLVAALFIPWPITLVVVIALPARPAGSAQE